MEMKIKDGIFWVIDEPKKKESVTIFDNLDDAVRAVKKLLQQDTGSEEVNLTKISLVGDKINSEGVAWRDIGVFHRVLQRLSRRARGQSGIDFERAHARCIEAAIVTLCLPPQCYRMGIFQPARCGRDGIRRRRHW